MSSPAKQALPAIALEGIRFVARQPILDRDQQVVGYELLFRDGIENVFRANDANAAACSTLASALLVGFDLLCNGQKAFINCTRELLLKDDILQLPAAQTVVEVLESVEPDDLVAAALTRLKAAGYTIALDDFVAQDPREALIPFADMLKIDFKRTTHAERVALVQRYQSCILLAEKVETREQLWRRVRWAICTSRDIFFVVPKFCRRKTSPRAA